MLDSLVLVLFVLEKEFEEAHICSFISAESKDQTDNGFVYGLRMRLAYV
jgi:hypothetical protein